MTGAELGKAQGQVAIRFQALIIDLNVARAVHGFQRVGALLVRMFLIDLGDEHVFAVLVPVARFFPQLAVNDLRRADFAIVRCTKALAHVVFQRAIDRPAVRVPEHHARCFVLEVEQL